MRAVRRPAYGAASERQVLVQDALSAVLMAVSAVVVGRLGQDDGRAPDTLGWALLLGAHLPMVWRRRAPLLSFLALICFLVPYHALDYHHGALMVVSMAALYTVAATGPVLRSVVAGAGVVGVMLAVKFSQGLPQGADALRVSGWIVAFLAFGICLRYHRQNVAAAVERAERAELSREEEVRRRVVEERLRIARDLHDLLAHSITLVGVRTSVAAHVLNADPDRLDRAAVARALEDIAETCRATRSEIRATLQVLRSGPEHGRGPLPGLNALPGLAATARSAGAAVTLRIAAAPDAPPAVGAAAYRIAQEALTNAVRHGGPHPAVEVLVRETDGALHVQVTNRATEPVPPSAQPPGFGLVGIREQARSVGGTLEAGPRPGGRFEVRAVLPLTTAGGTGGGGRTAGPDRAPGATRESGTIRNTMSHGTRTGITAPVPAHAGAAARDTDPDTDGAIR
ncbi:sensor histidine kinase [Streptomyces sp. JW3]|uniref:sensor histidine kinase n=1 Tax=Streptomyces sp. JW3 TaxID=3456955 RepID=UPI003FA47C86